MSPGYLVASVEGPAPQSAPATHGPVRFLRAEQVLVDGDDFLLLPDTRLVLVSDERREILTIEGPNRVAVRAGGVEAYEPTRLCRVLPGYFEDPASAVETTAGWLRDERWLELARHYDLAGTDVRLSSLLDGSFFVRQVPPAVAHPAGFSRFAQPFAPSFSYLSHRSVPGGDVEVTVHVRIDQGAGMVQEGRDSFRMRASEDGLQHLPKTAGGGRTVGDEIHTA